MKADFVGLAVSLPLSRAEFDGAKQAGFKRAIAAHGPNTVGTFSCSKSTNEVNFLAAKLSRQVFGTNNIDSCNRT